MGGDEFVAFIRNISDVGLVEKKAQELAEATRFLFTRHNSKIEVSCSIGAALYNERTKDFDELYRKADMAMYRAKQECAGYSLDLAK